MQVGKILLGTLAYFASSFIIQGMLAFAVAGDYFTAISVFRHQPLMYLSMPAAVITGAAISALYQFTAFNGTTFLRGLKYGLVTGLIVTPIVALDIPGRFDVPTVEKWILIQGILGMLHSCAAGIMIALIHRKAP